MYYNRTLSDSFSKLLEPYGDLRWLFELVKERYDLDFLVGRNISKQWISIYRGLSKLLTISPTNNPDIIKLDADKAYKNISNNLFGNKIISENFSTEFENLVEAVSNASEFDRYYNNKKEGYFQNEVSRKFGICGKPEDEFIIIDKEVVIGYENMGEKNELYEPIHSDYTKLYLELSQSNVKRFGGLGSAGGELDFLALDKQGNILLIEFKDGSSSSAHGIYLSPFQIGMYLELFNMLPFKSLKRSVEEMIEQKKRIGLINPKWVTPKINENIVPILIVGDYNYKSSARNTFRKSLLFGRGKKGPNFLKGLRTYNFTTRYGLKDW